MNYSMLPLPGLSPACDKTIVAEFDGGLLSSDARILILRKVEQGLRDADRLAACVVHLRAPRIDYPQTRLDRPVSIVVDWSWLRRRQRCQFAV